MYLAFLIFGDKPQKSHLIFFSNNSKKLYNFFKIILFNNIYKNDFNFMSSTNILKIIIGTESINYLKNYSLGLITI